MKTWRLEVMESFSGKEKWKFTLGELSLASEGEQSWRSGMGGVNIHWAFTWQCVRPVLYKSCLILMVTLEVEYYCSQFALDK